MLVVKFIRGYKNYVIGDIAGFKKQEAEFFVSKNYAEILGKVEDVVEAPTLKVKSKFIFGKKMPKLSDLICPICGKSCITKRSKKQHLWEIHQLKK